MSYTYNNLPIVECPHCGKTFQMDDYYDISAGDTYECPKCEKEFHVLDVDHVTTARMGVKPL